jgi:hypothetical protein
MQQRRAAEPSLDIVRQAGEKTTKPHALDAGRRMSDAEVLDDDNTDND